MARPLVTAAMNTPVFVNWLATSGIRRAFNSASAAWYFYASAPRRICFLLLGDPDESDSEVVSEVGRSGHRQLVDMVSVQHQIGNSSAARNDDAQYPPQLVASGGEDVVMGEAQGDTGASGKRKKDLEEFAGYEQDHLAKKQRLESDYDGIGSDTRVGQDGTLMYKCTGVTGKGLPCSRWSRSAQGSPPVYHCCQKHEEQWNNRQELLVGDEE
ncbi:uncharacterized protein N0V89_007609 [Didymosphaeria variabile]|uniref:Uncharacterized protein n=1 Tax=Didymosphaeria variabile TaxID=1932322 RepID=A0A9W8XJY4_9PLEO|nr:uncharacterized protein N0V89_007609 [Didymosphaeria variabile]KAJ4352262.1 hypothetical protein N0V89_007609 [Didymosphaeria variabile]